MTHTHRNPRFLLVAFMATVATLCGADPASACDSMGSRPEGCSTPCGCCLPADPGPSARNADPGTANLAALPLAAETCSCRSEAPAAPAPRPEPRAESRRWEAARVARFERPRPIASPTTIARSIVPAVSPPRAPLYLRNARLLI